MADAADVYLKEYERLRDEVELNLTIEDSIFKHALTLLGALIAYVLLSDEGDSARQWVLSSAPLLFSSLYVVLSQKLNNNRRITHYIHEHLREGLFAILGTKLEPLEEQERPLSWDLYKHELKSWGGKPEEWWSRVMECVGGRFLVVSLAPFIISATNLGLSWPGHVGQGILLWAGLLLGLITAVHRFLLDNALRSAIHSNATRGGPSCGTRNASAPTARAT